MLFRSKSYADYYRAIDSYLIPFFGSYNIDRITPAVITDFHRWRKEKVGYELKASTQNNHNAALNAVFDYAIEKSYMVESQRPSLKNTGAATANRGSFTTDELIQLKAFIQQWSANARNERSRWLRELLGLYVTFVACTGVRPGTETEDLASLTDTLLDRYHDLMCAPGVRKSIVARVNQTILKDPLPMLKNIQAETLVMWGERDAMIPIANASDYINALPNSHLVILPNIGHLPQEEQPQLGLQALQTFLQSSD